MKKLKKKNSFKEDMAIFNKHWNPIPIDYKKDAPEFYEKCTIFAKNWKKLLIEKEKLLLLKKKKEKKRKKKNAQ